MASSQAGFLDVASQARYAVDALLGKLSSVDDGEDTSSVLSSVTFRTAVSSDRIHRSNAMAPMTVHRTIFLPLHDNASSSSSAGQQTDAGYGELERVASADAEGSASSPGDMEVDLSVIRQGMSRAQTSAQVLAILAQWVFPLHKDAQGSVIQVEAKWMEGVTVDARYGRVCPVPLPLLASPLALGPPALAHYRVQGGLVLASTGISTALTGQVCKALLAVEPGLLGALSSSRTVRAELSQHVSSILSHCAVHEGVEGLALQAVTNACVQPAFVTAVSDKHFKLPILISADVGPHGEEGQGYGPGLTVCTPLLYVLKGQGPGPGQAGSKERDGACLGRIKAAVVTRVAASGPPPSLRVSCCQVELSWYPGDETQSARALLLAHEVQDVHAALTDAQEEQDERQADARDASAPLAQIAQDMRALQRRVLRLAGQGSTVGRARTGKRSAGGEGEEQGATSVQQLKDKVREKIQPLIKRLLSKQSASASAMASRMSSFPAGSGMGGLGLGQGQGEEGDWDPALIDSKSLLPSNLEEAVVHLLDNISSGQAPSIGGVGGDNAFLPRPLAGRGVRLGGQAAAARQSLAPAVQEDEPMLTGAYTPVWAWGSAEHGCLGLGVHALPRGAAQSGSVPLPSPLPFAGDLGGWRVVSLACGWYHTVAMTDTGAVYTWGSNADGQLGHGPDSIGVDVPTPRLVDWFGLQHPLRVTSIAAGSDRAGSHTIVVAQGLMVDEQAADMGETSSRCRAALGNGLSDATYEGEEAGPGDDEDASGAGRSLPTPARTGTAVAHLGRVFAWGNGLGVGAGTLANAASPTLVKSGASDMYTPAQGGILAVTAGGGFSMALSRAGAVYSWGKYAQGRLGLGQPPESQSRGGGGAAGAGEKKRFILHSLSPLRVARGWAWRDAWNTKEAREQAHDQGEERGVAEESSARPIGAVPNLYGPPTVPVRSLAAGEGHALAVDAWGLLWAWGSGATGATGLGQTGDVLIPQRVHVLLSGEDPACGLQAWRGLGEVISGHSGPGQGRGRGSRQRGIEVILQEEEEEEDGEGQEGEEELEAFEDAQGFGLPSLSSTTADKPAGSAAPSHAHPVPPSAPRGQGKGGRPRTDSVGTDQTGPSGAWSTGGESVASSVTAHSPPRPVRFVRVFTGLGHSLAVDVQGGLWSWGGGGGPMLGHADEELSQGARMLQQAANTVPALAARIRSRQAKIKSKLNAGKMGPSTSRAGDGQLLEEDEEEREAQGQGELGLEADPAGVVQRPWLVPRRISSLDGSSPDCCVVHAGGGALHSWALTTTGQLLLWGKDDRGMGTLGVQDMARQPIPRLIGCDPRLSMDTGTDLPLLGTLACETVLTAASGGWHTVAVTAQGGSTWAQGLRSAWSLASAFAPGSAAARALLDQDTASVMSGTTARKAASSHFYGGGAHARPGVKGYDCSLVVEGGRVELVAHAAIIAARIPVLAEKIASEALPGRPIRLMLPGLTSGQAVRILEWAYCGGSLLPMGLQAGEVLPVPRVSSKGGRTSSPAVSSALQLDPSSLALAAGSLAMDDLEGLAHVHAEAPLKYWLLALARAETEDQSSGMEGLEDSGTLVAPPQARARQTAGAIAVSNALLHGTMARHYLDLLVGLVPGPSPSPGLTPYANMCILVRDVAPDPLLEALGRASGQRLGGQGTGTGTGAGGVGGSEGATWCLPAHTAVVCSVSDVLRATLLGPTGAGWDNEAGTGGLSTTSSGPLELVLPDAPVTVARLLVYMYTGTLPTLPLSAASASDPSIGPTPGIALPWRRVISQDESSGGGDGDAEGEGGLTFEPWGAQGVGGAYAVPRIEEGWTPVQQLVTDAAVGDRYGLPRMVAQAEALISVDGGRDGGGTGQAPGRALTPAQALQASSTLPLPHLKEAASVAALCDLPRASADPSWPSLSAAHADVVSALVDRALARNDGFYHILAQEAAVSRKATGVTKPKEPLTVLRVLSGLIRGDVPVPGGQLPLGPLLALFVLFIIFLSLAEYNTSLSKAVPYVNGGALLAAAGMAYYGLLTT